MTYILDPFQQIIQLRQYTVVPNTQLINEGQSVTFTITATVPNGTVLAWRLVGVSGSITNNDFSNVINPVTVGGNVTINNRTATVVITARNDLTTEGTETFRMDVRNAGVVVASSVPVAIVDTSIGGGDITVPGIPTGGGGSVLGSNDVRWNPSGTSVAFAHRINQNLSNATCVSIYDFNGSSLTKVGDFVQAKFGLAIDWANDTTLAVAAGPSGTVDWGLTVWTRNGNTFTKTYQNTATSSLPSGLPNGKLRYTPYGILLNGNLFNNDTTLKRRIANRESSSFVSGNVLISDTSTTSTDGFIKVYVYNASNNTFTTENDFRLPLKQNQYPTVQLVEANGNDVFIATSYRTALGYESISMIYRRNGPNSWTKVFEVPNTNDDPVGSGWAVDGFIWRNSSEFAIGRFMYGDTTRGIIRYNWSGSSASITSRIAAPGGRFFGLHYHPTQNLIAAGAYNVSPYFRIYRY